jgi:hypothetical protein
MDQTEEPDRRGLHCRFPASESAKIGSLQGNLVWLTGRVKTYDARLHEVYLEDCRLVGPGERFERCEPGWGFAVGLRFIPQVAVA